MGNGKQIDPSELGYLALTIMAVLLVMIVVVSAYQRWKRTVLEPPDDDVTLLDQFGAARQGGAMEEHEYRAVREVMIRRAREAGLVRPGPVPRATSPPEPPAPPEIRGDAAGADGGPR